MMEWKDEVLRLVKGDAESKNGVCSGLSCWMIFELLLMEGIRERQLAAMAKHEDAITQSKSNITSSTSNMKSFSEESPGTSIIIHLRARIRTS